MSENSPRWPGSNGAPGLDFSVPQARGRGQVRGRRRAACPVGSTGGQGVVVGGPGDSGVVGPAGDGGARHRDTHPGPGAPGPAPQAPAEVPVPARKPRPSHRTRKARLRLARIDPWSVMKTTFLFRSPSA